MFGKVKANLAAASDLLAGRNRTNHVIRGPYSSIRDPINETGHAASFVTCCNVDKTNNKRQNRLRFVYAHFKSCDLSLDQTSFDFTNIFRIKQKVKYY